MFFYGFPGGMRVAAQVQDNVIELFGGGRRRPAVDEPRVTKKFVAAHFGVSPKTIERYMGRAVNPLPYEKPFVNGAVRFVMSEVERWWRQSSESARAL
jgi:predicted DNA-binding transcriptional regulator AlpA